MRQVSRVATCLGLALLLLGCSAIPEGGDPGQDNRVRALGASGAPKLGQLAVAAVVTLTLANDESVKGWAPIEVSALDRAPLRQLLARALEASGSWDRVRPEESLAGAWGQHDDYIVTFAIENLRTQFDGHDGWWIPNILNFVINTPLFAWWVATEEYSLTFDATVTVTSVDSGAPVATRLFPIKVSGTFDDFDRGWQFLGPIFPSLDAESWRRIAGKLFPAARSELAAVAATEVDAALRSAGGSAGRQALERKTLVLAVGVSSYQDPRAFPPLPSAASDARAVSLAFRALGALPQHVTTLLDGQATIAAVSSGISEHLGRARDGDTVVLYFAGYGMRRQDGKARLLLYDARPGEVGASLAVDEVVHELARLRGKKLLVIDAGYAGVGRSVSGSAQATREDSDALDGQGVTVILAGRANDPVLAPEYLGSGLLTYHFVRELGRLATGPRAARLGIDRLAAILEERVAADAEYLGAGQRPRVVGLANGLALTRSDERESP